MAPTVISSCHCGANSIPLPDVPLPLHAYVCHCTSCRTRSGNLFVLNAFLREGIPFTRDSPPENIQTYTPTPEPGSTRDGTLFFCKNCSSLMFMCFAMGVNPETNEKILGWAAVVAALSLDPSNPDNEGKKMDDVVQVGMQFCVADTVDGGACYWTASFGEDAGKVLKHSPRNQTDLASKDDVLAMERATNAIYYNSKEKQTELKGSCHCKSVQVTAKRSSADERLRGSSCACDTCRKYSGVDVMSFVHVPIPQASVGGTAWPAGGAAEVKRAFPQIKVYESSEVAFRGSCATCGCNVFWMRKDNPQKVEFAAGIFGSDETKGIRHEDFINWKLEDSKISHAEDAKEAGRSKILVDHFVKAYDEWKKMGLVY